MESELVNLQRRVEELEAALAAVAAQQRPSRRRWRIVPVGMLCAGIVAIGLAVTLATGASATLTPQGPSKVLAPFQVFDNKGQLLFAVVADPTGGGGHAIVFNNDGTIAAEILGTQAGNGQMRINKAGATRVSLGIAVKGDAGTISLFSNTTQAQTILHGDVGIQQKNAQGLPVAQLGVDDNGQGYAMAANRSGTFMSKLSVAADGSSGRVEVSQGGDIKVLMGVLENGKGDVCAHGDPGKQVCLSGLAVKSLIRY
ncbi:MAG TPA: hypothetical protein VHE60_08745 [Pyrinomonadaceae bacterium]|nr:hypothetical protein [Pyrinomonadaceae bacterium]